MDEELNKPIIRNFEKRKVHSSFIGNIWGADLTDMQLLSKFKKGIDFLLRVIDILSKYGWVVPSKDKNGITITDVFQKILNESGCKSDRIWVDRRSDFYNKTMNLWLEKSDIETHSTHIEEKSLVAEVFIRTSKNKIYKYMT